ncbi:TetR/AcrR family transcriptional regulator [Bradyrhizobium embrapense]
MKKKPQTTRARAPAKKQMSRRSVIPPQQTDTPQRRRDILLTAVALFSEHGYNGVSLRDIADRANVPITLCSYYFGRKHELFMSLFAQSNDDIGKRLVELRAVVDEPVGKNSLERLVLAWAEPVLRMRADPQSESSAILVARALWDTAEEAQAAIEKFYDPIALVFLSALQKIMPDRELADLVWGYEWALGALLMHVADKRVERISNGQVKSGDPSKCDMLIRFVCAGLRSIPTTREAVNT